ncbi:unnamed protein product [Gongylonema pulchrum]|uniref:Transmembrane protein n=1 Tax=Gongylonema pulchrum TaxID=637853 RepID=A0A183DID2_9BILA|nr:unnamed protein product [Gongylonema pulchrum]
MHAHFKWKEKGVLFIVVPIFIGAFIITFYHHIAYKYSIYTICNGTQLKGNVRPALSVWNDTVSSSTSNSVGFEVPLPFADCDSF